MLDSGSEENTGSAMRLGSRVRGNRSLRNGLPSRMRFVAVANVDTAGA